MMIAISHNGGEVKSYRGCSYADGRLAGLLVLLQSVGGTVNAGNPPFVSFSVTSVALKHGEIIKLALYPPPYKLLMPLCCTVRARVFLGYIYIHFLI